MIKLNIKDKLTEKGLNKNQFSKLIQIGYPAVCAIYDGETTKISFDKNSHLYCFCKQNAGRKNV